MDAESAKCIRNFGGDWRIFSLFNFIKWLGGFIVCTCICHLILQLGSTFEPVYTYGWFVFFKLHVDLVNSRIAWPYSSISWVANYLSQSWRYCFITWNLLETSIQLVLPCCRYFNSWMCRRLVEKHLDR